MTEHNLEAQVAHAKETFKAARKNLKTAVRKATRQKKIYLKSCDALGVIQSSAMSDLVREGKEPHQITAYRLIDEHSAVVAGWANIRTNNLHYCDALEEQKEKWKDFFKAKKTLKKVTCLL